MKEKKYNLYINNKKVLANETIEKIQSHIFWRFVDTYNNGNENDYSIDPIVDDIVEDLVKKGSSKGLFDTYLLKETVSLQGGI